MDILALANKEFVATKKHRRYLHQHAEVGFEVAKTTAYIQQVLQEYGYAPKVLKKGGVVAEICPKEGDRDAFTLLRADIDGLRMREESGVPFACRSGNMHACGHDMHTAALLSAAKILSQNASLLPSPVRLLFQPAEEILEGGKYALSQGVCQGVERAFALHIASGVPFPCGSILFSGAGVSAPSADVFSITLTGKSCHGATPHEGIDAIAPAVSILQALHALAKEIPLGDGLLTVGVIEAGSSANVVADGGRIQGTCRAFDEGVRELIKRRIREIVRGVSAAYRVQGKVVFSGGCPALLQDKQLLERALPIFQKAFGKAQVVDLSGEKRRVGASEDFAYISREVPSLLVSVSAAKSGGGYPLHHPRLVFDEDALPTCVAAHLFFVFT